MISGEAFSAEDGPEWTTESVTARVRGYEGACSTLLAMALIGGYWAEEEHYTLWQRGARTHWFDTIEQRLDSLV